MSYIYSFLGFVTPFLLTGQKFSAITGWNIGDIVGILWGFCGDCLLHLNFYVLKGY